MILSVKMSVLCESLCDAEAEQQYLAQLESRLNETVPDYECSSHARY